VDFEKSKKKAGAVSSQLCDQFMMQRNYAKSFTGFKYRIPGKVAGVTILLFLNKLYATSRQGALSMRLLINSANRLNQYQLLNLVPILIPVCIRINPKWLPESFKWSL
jgi:hypothetical protein